MPVLFYLGEFMYKGYLVKVGNYEIPTTVIKAESYKIVKTIVDYESTRDANGVLHRTALDHVPYKVDFELVPMLTNTKLSAIMKSIQQNYTVAKERKSVVEFYSPEDDAYIKQEMYMPDIEYTMYGTYDGVIHYKEVRLAFIGY